MRDTPPSEKDKRPEEPAWTDRGGWFPLVAIAAIALIALTITAFGHPDGAPNAAWYRSLQSPAGSSCCDTHDCAETEYRVTKAGEIEALTPAQDWVRVPPEKILKHTENPTGYAVLCWTPSLGILCFIMPTMG